MQKTALWSVRKAQKVEKFCIRVNPNYRGNNLNFYSLPFKYMLAIHEKKQKNSLSFNQAATIHNQSTELFPKRHELYAPRTAISNGISMWGCYLANLLSNFRLGVEIADSNG
jgi:hypothetical protein